MVRQDVARLREIHQAVGHLETPHTEDGRIRYYLDANGRYPDRGALEKLLDETDRLGMRRQVLILEEPFPEEVQASVQGLGVLVAADESVHDPRDVARRAEQGYGAVALKPAGKTLSMTFAMALEARKADMACFVADSACPPGLVDWNRNVAARLAPLPGLKVGLMESNGSQNYARWNEMLAAHPWAGADWLQSREGLFHLNQAFYEGGGGLWPPGA
jgi:L-alanine-DL-glutamate epimerase-like enolase superfamily enzyme